MVTAVDLSLVCVICTLQSKDTRGEFEWKGERNPGIHADKPQHHLASLKKTLHLFIYVFIFV